MEFIIIIGWIILSFVIASMGESKTIGYGGALTISLLFSPIIGILIVIASGDKNKEKHLEEYQAKVLRTQEEQGEALIKISKIETKNNNNISVADELLKLKNLLDQDIITKNEFDDLKSKTINSSQQNDIKVAPYNANNDLDVLKKKVKEDELIVKSKDTDEYNIMGKSEHETAKEFKLDSYYIVVDENNKTSNQAKVIYTSARLKFKRDEIEPLEWEDKIRIHVSNEGNTYEMTKRQFNDVFDNVVQSKSYKESGYYHSHPTPSKANQFLVKN